MPVAGDRRMSFPRSSSGARQLDTPAHVAIIMDGNGRWARARGLPRFEGHRRGVEAVRRAVQSAIVHNVRFLTIYSFSSENWRRPPEEVAGLMQLLAEHLRSETSRCLENGVRIEVIGRRDRLASASRRTASCCRSASWIIQGAPAHKC